MDDRPRRRAPKSLMSQVSAASSNGFPRASVPRTVTGIKTKVRCSRRRPTQTSRNTRLANRLTRRGDYRLFHAAMRVKEANERLYEEVTKKNRWLGRLGSRG